MKVAGLSTFEGQRMAELQELLQYLMEMRGSDLYVKAGAPPHVRIDGRLHVAPFAPVDLAQTRLLAEEVVPAHRAEDLEHRGEVDFALSVSGVGRFRVHVYRQRGSLALVFRRVMPGIPSWEQLGLPPAIERVVADGRGLVLVTGPAGCGKTTTMNALVDHINESRAAHIVTIEDPVEYLHVDKQSIISQREVGTDTLDFGEAVRRALRQGPDVLVISDVNDLATLEAMLAAASTGHLVLATLPTSGAAETISWLIDFYPPHLHKQARHLLATALRAVVSQRLLERADGKGRTAAVELLVSTPKVYDCILDPDREAALERIIAEGEYHGMQTFDQALFQLFKDGLVSLRDALSVASQPEDLRIALQQAGLSPTY
ncbi:MAG TPA: PilT/PilU family type 4a pilus ATPase [Acidimicrobiales bacterium]